LVHLPQELAGVGGQGLDVAALSLRVDGVEGQRGLARARDPGEDDELVPGELERDVAEVVLPGPPNDKRVIHSGTPYPPPRRAPRATSRSSSDLAQFLLEVGDLVPEAGRVLEAAVGGGLVPFLPPGRGGPAPRPRGAAAQ